MDWNRVEGNWKEMKGKIKEKWGKLTDDDLEQAPRVVQKSRAPPREEKLVPLDPKT